MPVRQTPTIAAAIGHIRRQLLSSSSAEEENSGIFAAKPVQTPLAGRAAAIAVGDLRIAGLLPINAATISRAAPPQDGRAMTLW
jgi:hypothetical protein